MTVAGAKSTVVREKSTAKRRRRRTMICGAVKGGGRVVTMEGGGRAMAVEGGCKAMAVELREDEQCLILGFILKPIWRRG